MKNAVLFLTVIALLALGCAQQPTGAIADTIYINGRIYTVNEAQPWAEAVAIRDDRFLVVGSAIEVEAVTGDATEVVDLDGRMVLPGLVNLHTHPLSVAEEWAAMRATNPDDADAILEELRQYAEAHPDLSVIRGGTWNLGVFPGNSPRKELLDEVVPDRPVFLMSQTGHSAWVNSAALELAGITKDTKQTSKIIFDTDPTSGEPSGTVREFALGMIERIMERAEPERYAPALARIATEFNKGGFTSVAPAEGGRSWIEGANHLDRQGGLTLRLFPAWDWATSISLASSVEEAESLIGSWEDFRTDRVYPRYVKVYYDSSPDSYTALLLEDYEGRPGFKGATNIEKEEAIRAMTAFNEAGIGMLTHVLGDGGGRELVDVYAAVRERSGDTEAILHFSHAWMTRPEDLRRLADVPGVCVDFSPALNYPADAIIGSMVPPLGEERYQSFFNVRAAFEAGLVVGFGDDWSSALIPDPDAFHQIQSWVTRRDPEDPDRGALNEGQAITVEQAIVGFTINGARCFGFGWDDEIGSIEAGKLADMIVIDQNILEVPVTEIYKTRVLTTVVGGRVVYELQ
jgi:predicted amidohydrolase YtcJ